MEEQAEPRKGVRDRARAIKAFRCRNLIAVPENPTDVRNLGTVIRNVNALGVEKVYVVDPRRSLPEDWQALRVQKSVSKSSVSAVKWTFVKRFDSTEQCFDHLEHLGFRSIVTSPHVRERSDVRHDREQRRLYQSRYRRSGGRGERQTPLSTVIQANG